MYVDIVCRVLLGAYCGGYLPVAWVLPVARVGTPGAGALPWVLCAPDVLSALTPPHTPGALCGAHTPPRGRGCSPARARCCSPSPRALSHGRKAFGAPVLLLFPGAHYLSRACSCRRLCARGYVARTNPVRGIIFMQIRGLTCTFIIVKKQFAFWVVLLTRSML